MSIGAARGEEPQAPGTLDARSVAFGAGTGTLNLNHTSRDYPLDVVLSGAGTIDILAGTTTLTGNSGEFEGMTRIEGGTLRVRGTLGGGLEVGSGGRLEGDGNTGATAVSGTIAPGTSIGTLTIGGAFVQASGSTYEVEIEPGGSSDRIEVRGTASIANDTTVRVLESAGQYTPGTRYTILLAEGGVSGTYARIEPDGDLPFLELVLAYDSDAVHLDVERSDTAFADIARSTNHLALGRVLDQLEGDAEGDLARAIGTIVSLDEAAAVAALEQIAGEEYATLAGLMIEGPGLFSQAMTRRLAMLRPAIWPSGEVDVSAARFTGVQLAAAGLDEEFELAKAATSGGADHRGETREGTWVRGYGNFTDLDGDDQAGGADVTFGGVAFGFDHRFTGEFLGGISLNYGRADINFDDGADGNVDSYAVGLYGSYGRGPLYVDAVASYSYLDNKVKRPLTLGAGQHAGADYAGHRGAVYVETGYGFALSEEVVLQPLAAAQYVHLHQDGFHEDGAGDLDLLGDSSDVDSFRTSLGLRLSRRFVLADGAELVPEARARWQHEFLDDHATLDATFRGAPGAGFTLKGVETDRDSAILGVGVTARSEASSALFVDYDAELNADQTAHNVTAGVRLIW